MFLNFIQDEYTFKLINVILVANNRQFSSHNDHAIVTRGS
jgi:hypothetical protein